MKKSKKETEYALLKKESLRAKELLLSEEYRKDISHHEELEEELSKWRMVERALRNPALTPNPIPDKQLIYKKSRLYRDCNTSYDAILKKYSISRPVSLELLKQIADGLEQKGLRHRDEIPVKMLTPDGACKIIKHDGYEVALDSMEQFSIKINPRGSKTDILHYISKILDCCVAHGIKAETRFRDERLRDLEIYRLRTLRNSFKEIGANMGINEEAVRKAFSRGYKLINGEPYKGGSKAKVTKALLIKECSTCKDRQCIKLCDEIESYANGVHVNRREILLLSDRDIADPNGPPVPAKGKGSPVWR